MQEQKRGRPTWYVEMLGRSHVCGGGRFAIGVSGQAGGAAATFAASRGRRQGQKRGEGGESRVMLHLYSEL